MTGRRRSGLRRVLTALAMLAGIALAARVLATSSDELFTAADNLTDLRWGWVVAAVLLESVCYLARGAAQRRLLVSGASGAGSAALPAGEVAGVPRAGTLVLAATTLAGDAVAYCLPFGFAAAGVVTLRVLRRRRIGEVLAGWMFGVATLLYVAVLAALAVVAAGLAGDQAPAGLQALSAAVLVVLVAVLGVVLVARAGPGSWLARPALWLRVRRRLAWRWLTRGSDDAGRAASTPAEPVPGVRRVLQGVTRRLASWWGELRLLRLTPAALALATVLLLVSWSADISVLAVSYAALGVAPPWAGLLLAYCAGQIASSVPITPGGIGVVEGSLTLALVAFGGSTETTLAAVLVYRLVSHWACIPAGGVAWLALRVRRPEDAPRATTPVPALAVPAALPQHGPETPR